MIKPLPQNIEAETVTLGIILNKPDTLTEIIGTITDEDFYQEKHKIIYNAIAKLFTEDKKIDMVTITSILNDTGTLQQVGGITYLAQLIASTMAVNSIKAYAEILKEKSNKRKLIKIGQELMEQGYEDSKEAKEVMNHTENELFDILSKQENKIVRIDKALDETLAEIEKQYKQGGAIVGIPTGFQDVDRVLSGLQRQDFIIIAARPSMGKTTLAINIASNVSKTNTTAIFSLEMSKNQLVKKIISSETLVKAERIKNGQLQDDEWGRIAHKSGEIASRKLFIDDQSGVTINEIKAKCKKIKMQHGLDVVIIDYLQLMSAKAQSREQEISTISRGLKQLAKELDVTVIALSQLSRACEARANKRPMLSDLRESGSIEQDADTVIFLYRDEYYNPETKDKHVTEIIFGKNRNGQVGTVKVAWMGEYQKFANLEQYKKVNEKTPFN